MIQLFLLAVLVLSGCSAVNTLHPYPSKIMPAIDQISRQNHVNVGALFRRGTRSNDRVLFHLEAGRIAQIQGDYAVSLSELDDAIELVRERDAKAVLSVGDTTAKLAAIMVNDNAIPYHLPAYERVLLHHYQALNYAALGQLDDALVEVRLADAEQRELELDAPEDLALIQTEIEEQGVDFAVLEDRVAGPMTAMTAIATTGPDTFLNAYTYFLSGLLYESVGQLNDAYIDYQKALRLNSSNNYLVQDVVRLGHRLGMTDDLISLFGVVPEIKDVDGTAAGFGELIIVFEDDFIPQKQEIGFIVPILDDIKRYVAVAIPVYESPLSAGHPLRVVLRDGQSVATEPLCDVYRIAVKTLKQQMPPTILRQTVRAVTKSVAVAEAKRRFGVTTFHLAGLLAAVTERADLRSWLTLPENVQISRMTVAARQHTLTLDHPALAMPNELQLTVPGGGKSLLHVVRTGHSLYCSEMVLVP